jgi:hypothetical protein
MCMKQQNILILCTYIQKSPAATVTSANKRPAGEKRTPGEAFTRVDAEIWNKEVLEGLEDNSCKCHSHCVEVDVVHMFVYFYSDEIIVPENS